MSKSKTMDIGSNMSFKNISRNNSREKASYSLSEIKPLDEKSDQIVKIDISSLESAPDEWNFYPKLEAEEFANLVKSIVEHGLLHPIVVRKIEEKHIILSGHNRVRAYKYLKAQLENINPEEAKLYDQIMAVIKENIDDEEAREIIIDANYVQRQLGQKLMTRSIIEKYRIVQERRKNSDDGIYKNIKTREIVASAFSLSGRHVDRYKKLELLNKVLLDEFYQGKISLELAAKLAGLKTNVQDYISQNYLTTVRKYPARVLENLKPSLTQKDIDKIIDEILEDYDQMKISLKLDGKRKNYTITDLESIEKIKQILEEYNSN